jgi:hypothetical protein
MLTVWRRLHVEVDSMGTVTNNIVSANVVSISGSSSVATGLALDVNLRTGLNPQDNSQNLSDSPPGNGRFENGWVKIGVDQVQTTVIDGNGDTFVQRTAGFNLPSQIVMNGGTLDSGQVVALAGSLFTVTGNLGTNLYIGGSFRAAGTSFTISTNTANTVTVTSVSPTIPIVLHDDDDDGILPHLPDTALMVEKFAPAYILPLIDGGGDLANNKQSVSFTANDDHRSHSALDAEFNKTGAFESESYRSSYYWIAYILTAYQGWVTLDYDPDGTNEWGPNGVNGGGTSLRRGALYFHESTRDYGAQNSLGASQLTILERRLVVHEIGHQFGLEDNTGGIYDYSLIYNLSSDPQFLPSHLAIMRSKIDSPGE